jgi:hypothetical protein
MRAFCSVIAVFLTCSCNGMLLVSCKNMFRHFSIAVLNTLAHSFGFVSFMLKWLFTGWSFVYCFPWSMFHVMGKWSVVNEIV